MADGAPGKPRAKNGTYPPSYRRWGIGLCWSYHSDARGLSEHIIRGEDYLGGSYDDTPEHIIGGDNPIGVVESHGLARAFQWARIFVPPTVNVIILTDRMASLRTVENNNGKPLVHPNKQRTWTMERRALQHLRTEMYQCLLVHDKVYVEFFENRGYNDKWRPDTLSRWFSGDSELPDFGDPYEHVKFNFDAEGDRWNWNDEMYGGFWVALEYPFHLS